MAEWKNLSAESIAAAKAMREQGHFRSCVSRAYYAVYAAATAKLMEMRRIRFPHGWRNPAHRQLRRLVLDRLRPFSKNKRRELASLLLRLRIAREDADYRPQATVDRELAFSAVRDARLFLKALEIGHGAADIGRHRSTGA